MTDKTTSAPKTGADKPRADGARVATTLEEAHKIGFLGREVDPTPDENYSLQTPPDAPTPETDPDAFAKAQQSVGLGADSKFTKTTKGGRS